MRKILLPLAVVGLSSAALAATPSDVRDSVDEPTPDVFTSKQSGDWDGEGVWEATATARAYPFVRGDKANVAEGHSMTLGLDVTLSWLTLNNNTQVKTDGRTPVTLHLQAASGAERAVFEPTKPNVNGGSISLGLPEDAELMTLSLDSPVHIDNSSIANNNRATVIYVYAKLDGGTSEAPSTITMTKKDASYSIAELYLENPANSWRGDIVLDNTANSQPSCYLFLYGVGSDAVFGHADNRICLYGSGTQMYLSDFDASKVFSHGVCGSGAVYCQSNRSSTATLQDLVLGNGFVADPCVVNGDYGSLVFSGNSITWQEDSTCRVNVGKSNGKLKCDTLSLTPKVASSFNGKIEVVADGDIALGTEFAVMTVAKHAKASAAFDFTFAPSSVSKGWYAKCTGDYNRGWTVSVVKARDGADVVNYPMSLIAGDHATANFEVTDMGGKDELTVRSYWSTTDWGADIEAWGNQYVETVVTAKGRYSKRIDGLEPETTYYFTHAVVVDGKPVLSLSPAESCLTSDAHPESYTWLPETGANWDADGAWSFVSSYERATPGVAGDSILINAVIDTTRALTLDRDASVGTVTFKGGSWNKNYRIDFVSPDSACLALDNAGARASVLVTQGLNDLRFGSSSTDSLVLRLSDDCLFQRSSDNNSFNGYFYAKVTGGTPETPVSMKFQQVSPYGNTYWYLLNTNNDFCADLSIETPVEGRPSTRYHRLQIGDDTHPFADSMLGNRANTVTVGALADLLLHPGKGINSVVWSRTIRGTGTLQTGSGVALDLAASARIEPMAYGAFTVKSGAGISDALGTRYAIDIDADNAAVSDKIAFITSSPLALAGAFEIVPDDPSVKIPIGTRWTVGSVDKTAGSVGARRIKCATPGFRIFCEGDADSGWTLFAERTPAGLLMIVK